MSDIRPKPPVTSITPFTFQDYPEHTACILWFSGCNMACSYCHNPELVRGILKKLPQEKIYGFLESRIGLLEGVVLSGGECTLYRDLQVFARELKNMGYKVKIDTNGSNPQMIESMIKDNLIDFIALDFKAPKEKFSQITRSFGYENFYHTLSLICTSQIKSEIRTTVHADLLSEDNINGMIDSLESLNYKGSYYLQKFRDCRTLGNLESPVRSFDIANIKKSSFEIGFRGF